MLARQSISGAQRENVLSYTEASGGHLTWHSREYVLRIERAAAIWISLLCWPQATGKRKNVVVPVMVSACSCSSYKGMARTLVGQDDANWIRRRTASYYYCWDSSTGHSSRLGWRGARGVKPQIGRLVSAKPRLTDSGVRHTPCSVCWRSS